MWLDMEAHKKLVLLSLCENADQHGLCYPGREYIATRASVSPRNASTHLVALEDEGWVRVIRRGRGPGQLTIRKVEVDRIIVEGRRRQDNFSSSRGREKPPLLELLEEADRRRGERAESAPIQPEIPEDEEGDPA